MLLTKRTRRCKVCRTDFQCRSMTHKVCSLECALSLAQSDRAKAERKATLQARKASKTRSDYVREAQTAVNAYVRSRDAQRPCISCGRYHAGQNHAGHYRSVGSAPHLRFDADRNIHLQCAPCNTYLHGNIVNYRAGLINRIGLEAVDALEADQGSQHYTIDDLIEIRREYIAKRKALEAAQ